MEQSRPIRSPAEQKQHAFTSIFLLRDTYGDILHRLRALGVPLHDRPDLAQEIMERAFRSWSTYDPLCAPYKHWLNGIIVRVAVDYHRARAKQRRLRRAALSAAHPSPTGQDLVDTLESLRALPSSAFGLVVAYDVEGIPMKTVARGLGIGVSTAYNRRSTVRAALEAA